MNTGNIVYDHQQVTIVIPCVTIENLVEKCVLFCAQLYPLADILVLTDMDEGSERVRSLARVMATGNITIAAKRNLAARSSDSRILAFIDSDAYPMEGWLENAIYILDSRSDLGAVGGPNLTPPDSDGTERYVGFALKSLMVSGLATFRKEIRPSKDVDDLPTCNLIVRRDDYLKAGGMNESLFTGEDMEYCRRIILTNKKIHYCEKVRVYHKCRNLKGFISQRLTYGASVPELLRLDKSGKFMLLTLPALFIIFLGTFPLTFYAELWGKLYFTCVFTYVMAVLFEAWRVSEKLYEIPIITFTIIVGNLMPGIGTLAHFFKVMPNKKNIYCRNSQLVR